jgi:hypothetical protein
MLFDALCLLCALCASVVNSNALHTQLSKLTYYWLFDGRESRIGSRESIAARRPQSPSSRLRI